MHFSLSFFVFLSFLAVTHYALKTLLSIYNQTLLLAQTHSIHVSFFLFLSSPEQTNKGSYYQYSLVFILIFLSFLTVTHYAVQLVFAIKHSHLRNHRLFTCPFSIIFFFLSSFTVTDNKGSHSTRRKVTNAPQMSPESTLSPRVWGSSHARCAHFRLTTFTTDNDTSRRAVQMSRSGANFLACHNFFFWLFKAICWSFLSSWNFSGQSRRCAKLFFYLDTFFLVSQGDVLNFS